MEAGWKMKTARIRQQARSWGGGRGNQQQEQQQKTLLVVNDPPLLLQHAGSGVVVCRTLATAQCGGLSVVSRTIKMSAILSIIVVCSSPGRSNVRDSGE